MGEKPIKHSGAQFTGQYGSGVGQLRLLDDRLEFRPLLGWPATVRIEAIKTVSITRSMFRRPNGFELTFGDGHREVFRIADSEEWVRLISKAIADSEEWRHIHG